MAFEEEVNSELEIDFTFDELQDAFYELANEFKKLKLKNKVLKEQFAKLSNDKEKSLIEIEKLTQESNYLKNQNLKLKNKKDKILKENQILKEELEKIKSCIEKFSPGSKNFQMILNNHRIDFNQKFIKNMFARAFHENHSFICFRCNKRDHKAYECNTNRYDHSFVKQIWVPKGTIVTNSKGPKKAWIPKSK